MRLNHRTRTDNEFSWPHWVCVVRPRRALPSSWRWCRLTLWSTGDCTHSNCLVSSEGFASEAIALLMNGRDIASQPFGFAPLRTRSIRRAAAAPQIYARGGPWHIDAILHKACIPYFSMYIMFFVSGDYQLIWSTACRLKCATGVKFCELLLKVDVNLLSPFFYLLFFFSTFFNFLVFNCGFWGKKWHWSISINFDFPSTHHVPITARRRLGEPSKFVETLFWCFADRGCFLHYSFHGTWRSGQWIRSFCSDFVYLRNILDAFQC